MTPLKLLSHRLQMMFARIPSIIWLVLSSLSVFLIFVFSVWVYQTSDEELLGMLFDTFFYSLMLVSFSYGAYTCWHDDYLAGHVLAPFLGAIAILALFGIYYTVLDILARLF